MRIRSIVLFRLLVVCFLLLFLFFVFCFLFLFHNTRNALSFFRRLRLIDAPVDVEGVTYGPLDPDYEELLKRAKSKPIPIPIGPKTPLRHAARRLRVSPMPRGTDDDDIDFDEGVFFMSLPEDQIEELTFTWHNDVEIISSFSDNNRCHQLN